MMENTNSPKNPKTPLLPNAFATSIETMIATTRLTTGISSRSSHHPERPHDLQQDVGVVNRDDRRPAGPPGFGEHLPQRDDREHGEDQAGTEPDAEAEDGRRVLIVHGAGVSFRERQS